MLARAQRAYLDSVNRFRAARGTPFVSQRFDDAVDATQPGLLYGCECHLPLNETVVHHPIPAFVAGIRR